MVNLFLVDRDQKKFGYLWFIQSVHHFNGILKIYFAHIVVYFGFFFCDFTFVLFLRAL